MSILVRARAPLRLSFGGGGTDVSPYPEERGGVVLSTTIDKFAYATVQPRRDTKFEIHSIDFDRTARYAHVRRLPFDGDLDLIKAVVRRFKPKHGASLVIHSDAPPGSGLGSSSTLVVALVAALREWLGAPLTAYDMAELAYAIERVDLGIAGGRQDQYAAAFGGFNFIEFQKDATIVNPLRVPEAALRELEYRLLLCYLNQTRSSADIITRQRASYVARKKKVVQALDALKASTYEMKRALLLGDIDGFGAILHEAWMSKKKLDAGISTDPVDALYEKARRAGAIGGKMPGAGGGGYFLVLCKADKRHAVAKALEGAGGQLVPFAFTHEGVTAWTAGSGRSGAARRTRA